MLLSKNYTSNKSKNLSGKYVFSCIKLLYEKIMNTYAIRKKNI